MKDNGEPEIQIEITVQTKTTFDEEGSIYCGCGRTIKEALTDLQKTMADDLHLRRVVDADIKRALKE